MTPLTRPTQTGAGTFGLRLDGGFGLPKIAGKNAPVLSAQRTGSSQNDLFITVQDFASEPTQKEFQLYIKDSPGTYLLNRNTDSYPQAPAAMVMV